MSGLEKKWSLCYNKSIKMEVSVGFIHLLDQESMDERGVEKMTCRNKRLFACLLAFLVTVSLVKQEGAAVLENTYFTAVNDKLMPLTAETMPFWSNNILFVCCTAFENTDLGVRCIRNYNTGRAVLYTREAALFFNLENRTVYDKNNVTYNSYAIEIGELIFFPLDFVCRYFGLSWSQNETRTVPLIRIKSDSAVLDDSLFINAASSMMASRYAEYEKLVNNSRPTEDEKDPDQDKNQEPNKDNNQDKEQDQNQDKDNNKENTTTTPPDNDPVVELPPIHAAEGQKVYLVLSAKTGDVIRSMMTQLGDTPATFLLTVQQMEDGDLIRALLGSGHGVALMVRGSTESEIREELLRARELVWTASCSLLQLVWYDGKEGAAELFEQQGCINITVEVDRRANILRSEKNVDTLMRVIGQYQEDVSVYLGDDGNYKDGLKRLLSRLLEAEYRLCAWRMTH